VKYAAMGYTNVKALGGGVEAWKKAGYTVNVK
jgi:rhodanese-related sulfurtransferase